MKQIQAVLPLLLIIVVLIGALILVRPGGPLMPGDTNHSDTSPPISDGDKTDAPSTDGGDTTPQTPNGNETQTPPANDYQYSCDITPYLPAISTSFASKQDILLVNKQNPLGQFYTPVQLVTLHTSDTNGKSIQLDSTAAAALKAMLLCMRADGITDTFVTSAYRSYNYQIATHNNHIQTEQKGISQEAYDYLGYDYIQTVYLSLGKTKLSYEDARAVALSYSAEPGKSEHQSGLCVDFMTTSMSKLVNEQFEPTAAFRWLQENACQFGFILRYPKDRSDVTGYSYESWHYRFVGREAAIEITRRGITLEEYLSEQ
jgi:LAS superfamily LD-carboxypeptidase LdcB